MQSSFLTVSGPCFSAVNTFVFAKVPAKSIRFVKTRAGVEQGEGHREGTDKNAHRDGHRFVHRWGLSWRIPFSTANLASPSEREAVEVPYLSPKSWLQFLLSKHPELLNGGFTDVQKGQDNLEAFWKCYKAIHPSHAMFSQDGHEQRLRYTVPMSLHGDEGRGLKKGHTLVCMIESNLGLQVQRLSDKRRAPEEFPCCSKRLRTPQGFVNGPGDPQMRLAAEQMVNLQQHSFLTKFVLCALNNKLFKPEDDEDPDIRLQNFLAVICEELTDLATEGVTVGGRQWWMQLTGVKGDLDFFRKAVSLKRCWKKQIGRNMQMCHECGAGVHPYPFEDCSSQARWRETLWFDRPWPSDVRPALAKLPFEPARPEKILRRDLFHNTKKGVFTDYIGSAVCLMMWLGYYNEEHGHNNRSLLFKRAHGSFKMYCCATSQAAALRSFSSLFFNSPSWTCYPWVSCKGSDSMVLLKWIQVQAKAFLLTPLDPSHSATLELIADRARYAVEFTRHTYRHNLWVPRRCSERLLKTMDKFLRAYNCLAVWSRDRHDFTGWAKKGKLHMVCHAKQELEDLLQDPSIQFTPSLQLFSCEGNEDVIGRISRLSRRCTHKISALRTLELYLIKCRAVATRFRRSRR